MPFTKTDRQTVRQRQTVVVAIKSLEQLHHTSFKRLKRMIIVTCWLKCTASVRMTSDKFIPKQRHWKVYLVEIRQH